MPRKSATAESKCFVSIKADDKTKETTRLSVCKDLPIKESYNFEGNSYCVLHAPITNKANEFKAAFRGMLIRKDYDFSFVYFPEELNFPKSTYTHPTKFCNALFTQNVFFRESDFWNVNFDKAIFEKSVSFNSATFNIQQSFHKTVFKGEADFANSHFRKPCSFDGVEFYQEANFSFAVFKDVADFNNAKFLGNVRFSQVKFLGQAHFFYALFSKENTFNGATFNDNVFFNFAKFESGSKTFFKQVIFNKAVCCINEAEISGYIHFAGGLKRKFKDQKALDEMEETGFFGEDSYLDLQNAYIEKPERISFFNLALKPSWFINVDCNKFVFLHCKWYKASGKYIDAQSEIKALIERQVPNPNNLLRQASWKLADNYEESKHFYTASLFRQIANESKRFDYYKWYKFWSLHYWYWLSSFYGESWQRALVVLFVILIGFALIYTQTNFQLCPNNQPFAMSITECKTAAENCKCQNGGLSLKEASAHSISTALFQNVEYRKPLTIWGEILTYLEKILAPLQAALLALAIRRKFMR
jgi:hypothetical protein